MNRLQTYCTSTPGQRWLESRRVDCFGGVQLGHRPTRLSLRGVCAPIGVRSSSPNQVSRPDERPLFADRARERRTALQRTRPGENLSPFDHSRRGSQMQNLLWYNIDLSCYNARDRGAIRRRIKQRIIIVWMKFMWPLFLDRSAELRSPFSRRYRQSRGERFLNAVSEVPLSAA